MTTALKELLRLWWTQKRRAFRWKELFLVAYFAVLFVVIVVALYAALHDRLTQGMLPVALVNLLPLLAVCVTPADLMMKLLWRRSPVEMDDYLRTRPVSPRDWALLILLDTKLGFMQWMIPLSMAFVVALFIGVGWGMLMLILTFTCTLVNALLQNCWRRAPGNQWTLPLLFGYIAWTVLAWAIAVGAVVWAMVAVASVLLILVNSITSYVLHRYFVHMKNHNEALHTNTSSTAHSLGNVSLWSIEWTQILRSKRLRTSSLLMMVLFLLNVYMQQSSAATLQNDFGLGVNPMLFFAIGFPSLMLAQWVFGVEANYFGGIWTKPWPVEGILRRKYYFFCALCVLMAVLCVPAVVWLHLSALSLVAALFFSCGVLVLPFMATCLYSSRMDLFSSAFLSYQHGNRQLNIFSLVMFLPMIIYFLIYFYLPPFWANVLVASLGLVGFALHGVYIRWVSGIWYRRRHEIMERWLAQ